MGNKEKLKKRTEFLFLFSASYNKTSREFLINLTLFFIVFIPFYSKLLLMCQLVIVQLDDTEARNFSVYIHQKYFRHGGGFLFLFFHLKFINLFNYAVYHWIFIQTFFRLFSTFFFSN